MLNECDFDNPLREIDNGEEHRPRPLDSCMRNPFKRTRSPSPIPLMLRPVKAKLARIGKSYLQSSEEMNLQAKNSDSEKSLRTVSVCKPEEVITIPTESGTTTVDSLKSSRAVAKDEGRVAEQQRPNDFNKNDDLVSYLLPLLGPSYFFAFVFSNALIRRAYLQCVL
ncbi:unnamed protein product [Toxocara canis]|uniref:Uncharacterized protein n=1 Tax=Toxocara canis TaxID=6265 RepID=A0A183U6J8_TOXCA|nr:unnamed protein product [Toxocara canis]